MAKTVESMQRDMSRLSKKIRKAAKYGDNGRVHRLRRTQKKVRRRISEVRCG